MKNRNNKLYDGKDLLRWKKKKDLRWKKKRKKASVELTVERFLNYKRKNKKNEANTRPIHDLKFRPESILTLQIPIFRLVSLC